MEYLKTDHQAILVLTELSNYSERNKQIITIQKKMPSDRSMMKVYGNPSKGTSNLAREFTERCACTLLETGIPQTRGKTWSWRAWCL